MTDSHVLPDPGTPFGGTARRRLREEAIIRLTTVGRDGTPRPDPAWFPWQQDPESTRGDGSFLIYNDAMAEYGVATRSRPEKVRGF